MTRRRHSFSRRYNEEKDPVPVRKYNAEAETKDRDGWCVNYDIIGKRVLGSMKDDAGVIVRRLFNVKLNGRGFAVDIGTGSGVKIEFLHQRQQQEAAE